MPTQGFRANTVSTAQAIFDPFLPDFRPTRFSRAEILRLVPGTLPDAATFGHQNSYCYCETTSLLRRPTIARWTALVKDDFPGTARPALPYRIESTDALASGIADRSRGHGQRSRIENLDLIRLPGEWRAGTVKKSLPAYRDLFRPAEGHTVAEEDRFLRKKRSESRVLAICHGLGESELGLANLLPQLCIRLGAAQATNDDRQGDFK